MSRRADVAQMGLDVHRKFSKLTGRNAEGDVVLRERLEHADRNTLHRQLKAYPEGTPVVLEGSFGWGWLSDELAAAGREPHLAHSRKVAKWREAKGVVKTNRVDADLLSELWSEGRQNDRWWEVWLAPPEVRDQREWLRYRMSLVRVQTGVKNRIHATLHRHGILHEFF